MVVAKGGYLLPAPLCAVIEDRLGGASSRARRKMALTVLGRKVGIAPRQIDRWLTPTADESGLVKLDHADQVLTRLGIPLSSVYGDGWIPIPRNRAERAGGSCSSCGAPMRRHGFMCGLCIAERDCPACNGVGDDHEGDHRLAA